MRLLGVLTVARPDCLAVAEWLAGLPAGGAAGQRFEATAGAAAAPGVVALPEAAFRPPAPFRGPLFAAVEDLARAATAAERDPDETGERSAAAGRQEEDQSAAAAGRQADEQLAADPGRHDHARPVFGLVVPARWLSAPATPEAPDRDGHAGPGRPGLIAVADHVDLALRGPLAGRWPAGRPRSFPSMTGIYQPSGIRSGAGATVYSRLVVAGVADTGHLSSFERVEARRAGLTAVSHCLVAPAVIAAYYGLAVAAVCVPQASPGPSHHE